MQLLLQIYFWSHKNNKELIKIGKRNINIYKELWLIHVYINFFTPFLIQRI